MKTAVLLVETFQRKKEQNILIQNRGSFSTIKHTYPRSFNKCKHNAFRL